MGAIGFIIGTNRLQPQNTIVFKIDSKRKSRIGGCFREIEIVYVHSDRPIRYSQREIVVSMRNQFGYC